VEHIRYSFQKLLELLEQHGLACSKVFTMPPMRPLVVAVSTDWPDVFCRVLSPGLLIDWPEVVNLCRSIPATPTLTAPPFPCRLNIVCGNKPSRPAPLGLQVGVMRSVVVRFLLLPCTGALPHRVQIDRSLGLGPAINASLLRRRHAGLADNPSAVAFARKAVPSESR
jgi:hypothetical protein